MQCVSQCLKRSVAKPLYSALKLGNAGWRHANHFGEFFLAETAMLPPLSKEIPGLGRLETGYDHF